MKFLAGVDEAGRGCLAGPVYAAAVMLPDECEIHGLRDSKQLSAMQRERLAVQIRSSAVSWAVARAEVAEIDTLNILQASLIAMKRAAQALRPAPLECWVDGLHVPVWEFSARAIVGGDGLHPAIMAASILAKVARDEEMCRLESEFPGYGFGQHKGYGTELHRLALEKLGPCRIHRRHFAPVANALALDWR